MITVGPVPVDNIQMHQSTEEVRNYCCLPSSIFEVCGFNCLTKPKSLSAYAIEPISTDETLEEGKQARAIIRVPPKEETTSAQVAYQHLPCIEHHKDVIGYIITSMGTQSYFWLFRHSNELKAKGKEINDVHPLKFLETVFSPEGRSKGLRQHMEAVMDSRFTRSNFIDGLGSSLTKKSMDGHLHVYLQDFASALQVAPHEIHGYFQNHDWEGMVRHLMKIIPN